MTDYFQGIDGLAPSSKKLFNQKLTQFISFFPDGQQDLFSLLTLPQLAKQYLDMNLKTNTATNRHLFYSAILTWINKSPLPPLLIQKSKLEKLRNQWISIRNDNQQPIIDHRLTNQPTEKQEEKTGSALTWDDIISKRDGLPIGSIERLLIGFYTHLPPVRADYGSVRVLKEGETSNEPNTLTLGKKKAVITLTDFKTAKKYVSIVNEITGPLFEDLMVSLKNEPRDWLFADKKGQPMSRNTFSVWSKRILSKALGAEFTVVMFRHLYLSQLDYNKMTTQQLQDLGKKMGQTVGMQQAYRWVKKN